MPKLSDLEIQEINRKMAAGKLAEPQTPVTDESPAVEQKPAAARRGAAKAAADEVAE